MCLHFVESSIQWYRGLRMSFSIVILSVGSNHLSYDMCDQLNCFDT
jgi:hypothetical protein